MKSKIMASSKAPMPKKSGMAGGTNTKAKPLAKSQQSAGNYGTGPGIPTTPMRGVPPQARGRGSSHDGPGAKATPHTTTFPPLNVGKAPNPRGTGGSGMGKQGGGKPTASRMKDNPKDSPSKERAERNRGIAT